MAALVAWLVAAGMTLGSPASAHWQAQAPDHRDQRLLDVCVPGGRVLHDVAYAMATRLLEGQTAWTTLELSEHLRARGEPHPAVRAWSLRMPRMNRNRAEKGLKSWLASHPEGQRRRCGIASIEDSQRGDVLTMLTVAVLADLLTPIPKTVRQGQWITLDAVLHDGAVEGRVVVLGPRGLPRVIPSSFDPATARVVARFMADRQGDWLLQVVGTTDAGPKPMLEAQVRVGPRQAVTHVPVPGEAAGHGLSDEQAMVAKLNAARVEEGLLPLVVDAQLTALAREHAKTMMASGAIGHDMGDGSPPQRLARAGGCAKEVGENVSRATSVTLAHLALWKSVSHRTNLLHPRYERLGVSALRDEKGMLWIVQIFAGPCTS